MMIRTTVFEWVIGVGFNLNISLIINKTKKLNDTYRLIIFSSVEYYGIEYNLFGIIINFNEI